jgi:hypothetical protein
VVLGEGGEHARILIGEASGLVYTIYPIRISTVSKTLLMLPMY